MPTSEAFVLFTTADTWLSWLIRLRTGSVASHCGVLVRTPGSEGVVYQSGGGGVSKGNLSLYLGGKRRIVKVLRVGRKGMAPDPDPTPGANWAESALGSGYGFAPDVELALGLSANWSKGEYNCSEFVGKFIRAMAVGADGGWLTTVRADAGVTPQELIVSMEAAGCEDVSTAFGIAPRPPARHVFGGISIHKR